MICRCAAGTGAGFVGISPAGRSRNDDCDASSASSFTDCSPFIWDCNCLSVAALSRCESSSFPSSPANSTSGAVRAPATTASSSATVTCFAACAGTAKPNPSASTTSETERVFIHTPQPRPEQANRRSTHAAPREYHPANSPSPTRLRQPANSPLPAQREANLPSHCTPSLVPRPLALDPVPRPSSLGPRPFPRPYVLVPSPCCTPSAPSLCVSPVPVQSAA